LTGHRSRGTVFIHPRLYQVVKKRLQPMFYHSQKGIPVAGHNNQRTGVVNQFFSANLVIDGHRTTTWFIFFDTGRHDLIIGRKWIESTRTILDLINRRIVWPADSKIDARRDIVIPRKAFTKPTINPMYQEDANKQNKLLDAPAPRRGTSWQVNPAITVASLGPASAPLVTSTISLAPDNTVQQATPATPTAAAPYKLVDYILQVNCSIDALQPYREFAKHHKQDWKPD
ncbi:hypothetical protein K469DRAFT_702429, partial [Zopfia rhizophila CBS 207.26]